MPPAYKLLTALSAAIFGFWAVSSSLTLGLGTVGTPGAGAWPFVGGVVILIAAVTTLFQPFDGDVGGERSSGWRVVIGMVSFVVFIQALQLLGIVISVGLFATALMRILGDRSWPRTILTAVGLTLAAYGIFSIALNIPLPVGPRGWGG